MFKIKINFKKKKKRLPTSDLEHSQNKHQEAYHQLQYKGKNNLMSLIVSM